MSPTEVLLHRVVWAVPFGALIIFFRRQWHEVRGAFVDRKVLAWLGLAAIAISSNWFIYIWAIHSGRIFDTSLGYYINPMLYVLVGVVFLGERLRRWQTAAVVLATVGVVVLSVSRGQFPWVAISLAVLFTTYGVIRKQIVTGAMPGLFVETILLFPFALIWLGLLLGAGNASFLAENSHTSTLLILAGPITVMPLLFFAIAARRLTLTTIGFLQFVGPTLQFFTGIYYGEQLTTAHLICFGLIWTAVVVFIVDAYLAALRSAASRMTSSATLDGHGA